jgi:hypothetical protein
MGSEGAVSSFIRQSSFQIVRKITIDEDKLKEIAKILGISDRDLAKGIAGKIYIGITPSDETTPTGDGASSTSSARQPRARRRSAR